MDGVLGNLCYAFGKLLTRQLHKTFRWNVPKFRYIFYPQNVPAEQKMLVIFKVFQRNTLWVEIQLGLEAFCRNALCKNVVSINFIYKSSRWDEIPRFE